MAMMMMMMMMTSSGSYKKQRGLLDQFGELIIIQWIRVCIVCKVRLELNMTSCYVFKQDCQLLKFVAYL
jgi:hypothetical protein